MGNLPLSTTSEIISFDNLDTYPKSEYIVGLEKATNLLFWVVDEELDRSFTGTYRYKDKLEGIGVYALARLANSEKGYRHSEWCVFHRKFRNL